ncbi:DNA-binding protein [Sinorhizobium meliloti CCBAU 01290]|nr:DNA-binding protein [Sinorhizobium meliloti CCBAU 01290]
MKVNTFDVRLLILPITSEQCRAGRAILGWSQEQLASASKVAKATIANFEAGKRAPYDRTLQDMQEAMETAGVIFEADGELIDGGPGVRLGR